MNSRVPLVAELDLAEEGHFSNSEGWALAGWGADGDSWDRSLGRFSEDTQKPRLSLTNESGQRDLQSQLE